MNILSRKGYIDSQYETVQETKLKDYLETISDIFEQTGMIVPRKTVEKIINRELSIEDLETDLPFRLVEDQLRPYREKQKELVLEKVEFGDGGNAVQNFPDFMRDILSELPGMVTERPRGLPQKESAIQSEISKEIPVYTIKRLDTRSASIEGTTINMGAPSNRYGRTLEYRNGKKALHFKFLKKDEELKLLSYEHDLMKFLREKKEEWGLKGDYPEGRVRIGRIKIKTSDLPSSYLSDLSGKEGSIEVDKTDGFYTFMAYETDLDEKGGNPYYTYLNDPDLSHEEFMRGFRINIHDRFVMARHGLFDMEIIELFHNQHNGDGRRYDWMVDIRHHQKSRSGAGRLNNITAATLYPNVRLSGPADFAGIVFVDDIINDRKVREMADNRISRLLNMVDRNRLQAKKYIKSALLGDTLLSLVLMLPTYLDRKDELKYEHECSNKDTFLSRGLQTMFEESYRSFTSFDEIPPELKGVDIFLMKKYIAYFLTDAYVGDLDRKRFWNKSSFPFPGTYKTISDKHKNGWVRGWTQDHGWDATEAEYKIPSRSGKNPITRKSRDLGYVNGFNPLQEFIKALYISTSLMTIGRYALSTRIDNEDNSSPVVVASNDAMGKDGKSGDDNVTCGTICEAGHEECKDALDKQLKKFYQTLAEDAGRRRDLRKHPLNSNEVIRDLEKTGKIDSKIAGLLQEIKAHIEEKIPGIKKENIQIFFAIPGNNTKLWWVKDPRRGKWTYAGGHFNGKGTRIHISLPLILSRPDPQKAALAIARHEFNHIIDPAKGHREDLGMKIVVEAATEVAKIDRPFRPKQPSSPSKMDGMTNMTTISGRLFHSNSMIEHLANKAREETGRELQVVDIGPGYPPVTANELLDRGVSVVAVDNFIPVAEVCNAREILIRKGVHKGDYIDKGSSILFDDNGNIIVRTNSSEGVNIPGKDIPGELRA
ncbi:hypothetical protein ACFL5C_03355, partial [Candidatus Omnitrophota bacterium]